jgi:hypothetical protein
MQMIITALKNDLIHQVITGFDPDVTDGSSYAVMELRETIPCGHIFSIDHHPNLTAFAKHLFLCHIPT